MSFLKGITGGYAALPEDQVPPPPEWAALWVHSLFRRKLESFLRAEGIQSYTFTSGYRTPGRNEAVGGASNSAHLHGLGDDVKIPGAPPGLVATWKVETGGYAADEGDHFHFNAPRAWGWESVRWLILTVLILGLVTVAFLLEVGGGVEKTI